MQATIENSTICEKKRQSESDLWLKEENLEWTQLYLGNEELEFSLLRLNERTPETGKIEKHIYSKEVILNLWKLFGMNKGAKTNSIIFYLYENGQTKKNQSYFWIEVRSVSLETFDMNWNLLNNPKLCLIMNSIPCY